jgi:hypothetical protein
MAKQGFFSRFNPLRLLAATQMPVVAAGRKLYAGSDFQKKAADKTMKNKDRASLVLAEIAKVETEPESVARKQKLAYLDYRLNNLTKLYVDASDETVLRVDDLQAIGDMDHFSGDGMDTALNADGSAGFMSKIPMWAKIGVPVAIVGVVGFIVWKKYGKK